MAVKNFSSEQKTVKSMFLASNSDVWSIQKTLFYANYLNTSIIAEGSILDDYYDYFENLLEEIEVPEEYYYAPARFSEYYYGDAGLDFLILYFAKIPTLFEFNKPKIKVFPAAYLKEFNKLTSFKKKEVDASKENPKEYLETYPITISTKAWED